MSPPEKSQPSARWAAVLQEAHLELEILSGETFTLPSSPKQAALPFPTSSSTDSDEIPWSVVVKKKGKKGKKKGKNNVSIRDSPAKSPSFSICGSFEKPVSWNTREVMKARTEWKHKKQRVYTYTPLPKDFQVYQDTKALSKGTKRRIIGGHRFHPQHGLESIDENGELLLLKLRLPRVEPIPHQRLGPLAVVPAPVQAKTLSWSQVATRSVVPVVPAVSVVPAVPKLPVKSSFTRVSVTPPVTKPAVPEVPAAKAPVTLKKEKKAQPQAQRPATQVSPKAVSPATPKLPKPPVDSTLRRQGSKSIEIEKSAPTPTKTLSWSQVAAKSVAPKVPIKR
ncbi:hypothetical protein NEUTE1DRAFT_101263 [Neurospora tetrasperma FGSC 2508]|uniref:Uncharacterized protein n=1 Tax=Neurospora tetrasperma (strain FGSC 2508 / ATCC MYA-4615 / P0657) TaxID=510951 RepID=F8MLK9_NEUT8|nr:uncharacterized protein NEUTE1DRAFT_101263 [Neurospora tetrasperma FGSC 2508]EGO58428.1 hypothetical protein NEUTE1DRAFT_101263 [Neurospora tetrasperma FGSC 2508]EGZ71238.1 hypothetical protein NEUTE2DRAFT_138480 [Neurospora tetrasperma FGSC 2509]